MHKKPKVRRQIPNFSLACTIGIISAGAALPSYAKTVQQATELALEEVVITATKRATGMQDVPIALSVMDGNTISEQGIGKLQELSTYIPNIHIGEGGAGEQMFIRGVGSGANAGFEQSVGSFVDGIYFGRGQSARTSFLDLERVEILKGPQSTLFGKNTVAGAINITSARPSDEFESRIELSTEPKSNGWQSSLILSGPLSETTAARLVVKEGQNDGYMHNSVTGEDERLEKDSAARIVLDWQASEDLSLSLKVERGKYKSQGRNESVVQLSDTMNFLFENVYQLDSYAAQDYTNSQRGWAFGYPKHDTQWDIFGLNAEWSLGEHSLRSITGYVGYDFQQIIDSDNTTLNLAERLREESHTQLSQEFIFASPLGGTIEYLAGLYFQDETLTHNRDTALQGSLVGMQNLGTLAKLEQDTSTQSAFTQLTWNATDSLRAIVGVRYSKDKKTLIKSQTVTDGDFNPANDDLLGFYSGGGLSFANNYTFDDQGARICGFDGVDVSCTSDSNWDNTRKESHVTGDITLQWDINGSSMTYFKLGNGYKAGGFDEDNSMGSVDTIEFEDESVNSAELGAKLDLLDGRARLNIALYRSEFENLQVSTYDGVASFLVGNAAKSVSQGIEIDGSIRLSHALTLNASAAYLDAFYDQFDGAACNAEQIAANAEAGACTQDLSGQALQYSPEISLALGLDYDTAFTDTTELHTSINVNYSSDQQITGDLDEFLAQAAFYKINARVQLASVDNTWSIALLGKNLTDEQTTNWGNDNPLIGGYFQSIGDPRTFELQLGYNF